MSRVPLYLIFGAASPLTPEGNLAASKQPKLTRCMDRLRLASGILQDIGSRGYVSGLFDRLAGRGHDGNTHAPLVSLADRLAGNHLGHQTSGALLDPFHAVISIANLGEVSAG